jgi:hypothetical protein
LARAEQAEHLVQVQLQTQLVQRELLVELVVTVLRLHSAL